MTKKFKAIVINNQNENFTRAIEELTTDFLKDGNVLVKVDYSSLNYKDALILNNGGRIVKKYPFVPGIDFSGIVEESQDQKFKKGDRVILTGFRVGEIYFGGFSGYVTQVALVVDHLPQLAAIYAPAFDQVFLAKRGFGAFLNGNRLSLGINGDTKTMIDNYPEPRGITKRAFNELSYLRYLECGGISLKICRVADGTADLFFKDVTVRDWDVGAPLLVLEEAGGSLVLSDGTPMKFNGAYDKSGLVAGRTPDLVGEVVSWLHSQKI